MEETPPPFPPPPSGSEVEPAAAGSGEAPAPPVETFAPPVETSAPPVDSPDPESPEWAFKAAPARDRKPWMNRRNLIFGGVALALVVMLIAAIVAAGGGGPKAAASSGSTPGAPSRVRAKATSFKVVLSWRAPSAKVSGYEIMRDGQNLRFVNYPATRFADDQALPGHRYSYSIKAFSTGSVWSKTVDLKVRTPAAPDSSARLTGSFTVKVIARRSFGLGAGNSNETTGWVFTPRCGSGPCSVRWTDAHLASMKAALKRAGANYSGSVSTKFNVVCGNKTLVSRFALRLRVTKAAIVDGEWRATKVKGTFAERTPAVLGCVKSGIDYTFYGSLVR